MSPPSPPDGTSSHDSHRHFVRHSANISDATSQDGSRPRNTPVTSTTALPPIATIANITPGQGASTMSTDTISPTVSRPFGVHNILNPYGNTNSTNYSRPSMSPGRSVSAAHVSVPPPNMSPRGRKRGELPPSVTDQSSNSERSQPRRILTPKSPSMRSASQGARITPSATATGRYPGQSVEGRVYTAEPGSGSGSLGTIPPLPPLSLPAQAPGVMAVEAQASTGRRLSHPSGASYPSQVPPKRPGSPDAHPHRERSRGSPFRGSVSEASYSHPPPPPNQSFFSANDGRAQPLPRTYGGQTTYQLQLPDNEHGTIGVPLEIDYQHASKVADEKRRRNAGASARFRQRRKEKEHAASQTITTLQTQLQEAQDDRDFYINERNFFRDLATRTLGANQLPPRPASPQLHRMQTQPQSVEDSPPAEYSRRRAPDDGSQSHQRRLTSDFSSNYSSPSSIAPPPSYLYPASTASTQLAPAPPASLASFSNPRGPQQSASGPPAPPPPPRSQSYDPFRRDILR